MVSALPFSARGHGFDPCDRRGKILVFGSHPGFYLCSRKWLTSKLLRSCPICKIVSTMWKHGSLVVSALAFSARGHGFNPCGRPEKNSVSEHAFLSVIYRDDTQ